MKININISKNKTKIILVLLAIVIIVVAIVVIVKTNNKNVKIIGESISETKEDESVVIIKEKTTGTIEDSEINKTGDTSDLTQSDKKGQNSAVLVNMLSQLDINNTTVNTSGKGASGVSAIEPQAKINISDTEIKTSGERSKGILAANKGQVNANNITIETQGYKSSTIATDFGGGIINVSNTKLVTNGEDSVGLYSTGMITAENVDIETRNAEGATIDGVGSIKLTNCNILAKRRRGVMIFYTGPEAKNIVGRFEMIGGSLTAQDGPVFYVMNTVAEIELENVDIETTSGVFLKASVDEYGELGQEGEKITSKGGNAKVTARNQEIKGNIVVDAESTAELSLENGSVYTGAVNTEKTGKDVIINLDSTSTWNLTSDCYITELNAAEGATINTNGHKINYIKN